MDFFRKFKDGSFTEQEIGKFMAILAFIGGMTFLIVVADFPPPINFIFLIPVLILLSWLCHFYGKNLFRRISQSKRKINMAILVRSIFEGIAAGFLIGLLFSFIPNGEPSISGQHSSSDDLILFTLVSALFGFCSLILSASASLLLINRNKNKAEDNLGAL